MFAVKFARSIKNNPKKSIAAAGALAWVTSYARDKYAAWLTVRAECESAVLLGRQPLNQFENATRVSVFLNPAANGGKSVKMYEKYAEPILHLAGFKVQLVKLQYEGEAKKLMSIVDDTDIIISAGGDGTLSEIVTGLLRRPDSEWKKIPIGILPLGKSNTLCKQLLPAVEHEKQPHFISKAATAITQQATTPVDVMKIDGSVGKTVYAVSGIRWGSYCDIEERAKKMWYFGFLKSYAAYFLYLAKGKVNPNPFKMSYSEPEEPTDFVECADVPMPQQNISGMSVLTNFFARLWPWQSSTETTVEPEVLPEPESQTTDNLWHQLETSSLEFSAEANTQLGTKRELASIEVSLNSDSAVLGDFINRSNTKPSGVKQHLETGSFTLSSPISDKQFISIDNDRYEAMDLSVKLMPNSIKMIHSPSDL